MSGDAGPDSPSPGDTRRMQLARSKARREIGVAEKRYADRAREIFRQEIGATVRSVSPFLIALLASDGLEFDDVIETIEPGYGWPRRPRLSSRCNRSSWGKHILRHIVAGLRPAWPDTQLMHGTSVDLSNYGSAKIRIDAHSIEVRVRLKTVTFDTCFGLLRIELGRPIPETMAIGFIGRLVEEVVDHASVRGSGWRVAAVDQTSGGSVLIVETGSTAYRLPWAR
ncbi:hypothetical protein SIL82_12345 [Sphingomonas echinoides]|uniref:Uncharacterized protein n=1 Tax=Sphingomonas echinoides TaxID=59803 RepID=A0ABU4PLR6_9SPHN|nr:hypothetical protein [Sphingomonas echinoides]MDX5985051.1 hypothetical protein [Sphingomonas echinoides]